LDNPLSSAAYGLEDRVHQRIFQFVAAYLGVPQEEAEAERARRIGLYGTTVEWLLAEKGLRDAGPYFNAIHPEDEADALPYNPALPPLLESFHLPLALLTNSPRRHAERILDKLRVRRLFPRIFDIEENHLVGKPAPAAFLHALDVLGVSPAETLFVDDAPRYVLGFNELGGRGVLFDEFGRHSGFPGLRVRRLEELAPLF